MTQASRTVIGLLFPLLLCSCSTPDDQAAWESVPLPDISAQPVTLSVANVVNQRFRKLSDAQIEKILAHAETLVKQHFDIEVELVLTDTLSIEQVFSTLNQQVVDQRRNEIVDLENLQDWMREDMQVSVYQTLEAYSAIKQSVIDYAQPWLIDPDTRHEDFISLSYALVDTLLARLDYWVSQEAEDGNPVVDDMPYHQWVWWDSLGYDALPYDVILTNQLVASAEYYGMDVHSSLRGGITAGTTTYSKRAKLGTYAYITVYPLINDSPLLTKLRADRHYDDEQVIKYAAALLTHELGHLLLHLGHPFGKAACVMSPTVMLDYQRWYDGFDADNCKPGSMPSMVPGAAVIEYNSNW
jgi:hypothetical protein